MPGDKGGTDGEGKRGGWGMGRTNPGNLYRARKEYYASRRGILAPEVGQMRTGCPRKSAQKWAKVTWDATVLGKVLVLRRTLADAKCLV